MKCPVRIYSNYAASITLMSPPLPCGIKVREGRTHCIFHWHLEDPPLLPYGRKPVKLSGWQKAQIGQSQSRQYRDRR